MSEPDDPKVAPEDPKDSAGEAEEAAVKAVEEEMRTIRVEDVILQSTVSILSLAARRIAKDDERDLAQGKAGIDASRALLDYLPDDAAGQVREAVSELQMLYAKHASEAT
jgi:F420-0:gamma-glutamyl ligase